VLTGESVTASDVIPTAVSTHAFSVTQEAKRLDILNFVVEDSIEERVLQRLLTKIEIFKESIGDPDPIIGEQIERLAGRALQGDLSP